MMRATLVLLVRELKKWFGRKPVLVMSLLTPVLWIALFGKSLNLTNMLMPPGSLEGISPEMMKVLQQMVTARLIELFGTTDYFTYMSSGMLVVFAVFQGMFSGISIIFDKRLGYMDRLLVAPIPRLSIWLSKILAVAVRVTLLSLLLLAVSLLLGMNLKEGVGVIDLLASWSYIILLAMTIASLYALLSFYADNQEIVFAAGNLLNLPLMFTSSAMFPVEQMPDWLQKLASANPVTFAADLVRYHLIGRPVGDYTAELVKLVVIALVMLVVSGWASLRWMNNR
ncbi:MAG: ABC transporter permease [Desulfurococcales archaeon]|nr:ABC transporter permease [Desulfurococcales archaeon]MEB3788555.1 ABC transporter permease [Desulfurococcales archaeon]